MTRVIISEALQSQLTGLHEQAELCDSAGRILGVFLPAGAEAESFDIPFTREEMERRRAEPGGRLLAEIWKSLGRS